MRESTLAAGPLSSKPLARRMKEGHVSHNPRDNEAYRFPVSVNAPPLHAPRPPSSPSPSRRLRLSAH